MTENQAERPNPFVCPRCGEYVHEDEGYRLVNLKWQHYRCIRRAAQ